jgi:hypothetical protein
MQEKDSKKKKTTSKTTPKQKSDAQKRTKKTDASKAKKPLPMKKQKGGDCGCDGPNYITDKSANTANTANAVNVANNNSQMVTNQKGAGWDNLAGLAVPFGMLWLNQGLKHIPGSEKEKKSKSKSQKGAGQRGSGNPIASLLSPNKILEDAQHMASSIF